MAITDHLALDPGTDAFNVHDLDRIAELLADDVVFQAPGGIRGWGRAACVEFFAKWFDEFPDAHLEVFRVVGVGEGVVEEGVFTGTHTGVARTGRSVALEYVQVLHLRDGKRVSLKLMFDRLLMLEQLGLIPDGTPA